MAVNTQNEPVLSTFELNWVKEQNYVFNMLPPCEDVDGETFRIPVFDKSNGQRQSDAKQTTRSTTKRSHSESSYTSGVIDTAFKLEEVVTPADVRAAGNNEEKALMKATRRLSRAVHNEIEIHTQTVLSGASLTAAAAAQWAGGGATDPIGDVVTGLDSVLDGSGGNKATHILMPTKTARRYSLEADVISRTKGSINPAGMTMAQLQDMLSELNGGDIKLLIAQSGYFTSAGVFTPVWNDTAGSAVTYILRLQEDVEDVAFMGGFCWADQSGVVTYDNPDQTTGGTVVGVRDIRKYVEVSDGAGYRITAC